MDEKEAVLIRNIADTRGAIGEKIDLIESRLHQAMEGPKATVDIVAGSIDDVKATMAETKSAVDYGIDTLHRVIDDTMVRVKSTAKLIERVQQEPWIMFGSAILLGYVIGSLNRADILVPQRVDRQIRESCRPERPASVAPLP